MPPGPSLAPPGLVKRVAVFSGEFIDRALHDTLRSHFADHPDVAVVLIVDRIGVHGLNAIAPYGVCAVVRTSELTGRPNLLTTVKATVAQGGYRLPAGLGASVRNTVAGPPHIQRPFGQPGILLKPFELDMVILAAQGRGKSGAAQQLGRTPGYVRNARKDLFQRLGVNTMAACVSYAAREGLLWNDSADGEPS